MSTKLIRVLTVLGALLVLIGVNYSIYSKEQIKRHGAVMFLELAPVDPRSLMQGDYMALRFAVAREIQSKRQPTDEFALLQLDSRRVAHLSGSETSDSLRVRYRMRDSQVWLGTNAYFFEEGSAARFTPARYGEFRVDAQTGEAVLVALCNDQLREL